jgi:hypothetical protein
MSGSYYTLNSKYNQLKSILAGIPITGSGLTGDLNANNYDILNVDNIDLTTINGAAYPPVVATDDLDATLTAGNSAGTNDIDMNNQDILNVNNINLNTINGAAFPPISGIVKQVVFSSTNVPFQTNQPTPQPTGLSGTITPSSLTSRIVILVQLSLSKITNNIYASPTAKLFRGSVAGTQINIINLMTNNTGSGFAFCFPMNTVDSPNTTSPQTYTVSIQVASTAETVAAQRNNSNSTMILMEID